MAASNGTVILPNPYTPMAYIPPELATKVTNQTYASIGALTVLMWDILLHLPQDYQMATRFRINASFIIYCIARMSSLAYVLGLVIITTAPVGNCLNYIRGVSVLYPFAIPLSVLPFVIRVSALFGKNGYVTAFFYLSWLSVVGGCIAMSIGSIGIKIGTTDHCSLIIRELPNALSSICPLIHDTLIFLATSWGFMQMSYDPGVKNRIKVVIFGKDMQPFTRSFLRDGQAYYLITLILNLCFVVLAYVPKTAITACTIGVPHFVIVSNMSSYVYRNMRLGLFRDFTSNVPEDIILRNIQPDHQRHEIVFANPTQQTMGRSEDEGDTDVRGADLEGNNVQTEISRGI